METGGWWAPTTLARFSCLFRSFTPRKLKWPPPSPYLCCIRRLLPQMYLTERNEWVCGAYTKIRRFGMGVAGTRE